MMICEKCKTHDPDDPCPEARCMYFQQGKCEGDNCPGFSERESDE